MANWYDNVPAPVDANGHEVPLDTRELVFDGERSGVYCFIYRIGRGGWSVGFKGSRGSACGAALSACTLPDSWERLEKDSSNGLCEYFGMGDAEDCKGCPAYGDRLSIPCSSVMARDIIRRAKALAGVADGE